MPTITLNRKVLENLIGKKLPDKELKHKISMLGTDLESLDEKEVVVEIFPNRPDMLSEQGFARAFSTFIGKKTGLKEYKVKKTGSKVIIKNLPPQWPYAVACVVKGLKFNDEKIREVVQLQEKLGATFTRNRKKGGLGLYPLKKITFPVTFTGRKPRDIKFRPLEFPEPITAKQILSKHPKGREYGHIMDGWRTYPVFVDAKGIVMSMPPVINSHNVGKIDETTTDVFIEGTGPDMNTIMISLHILVTSLADMGGTIESLEMVCLDKKFTFPDLTPKKMKININHVNKLLGLNLGEADVRKYLERMGFDYKNKTVFVPAYRADILHEVDLIEDIAIAYGFENFKAEIPDITTIGEEDGFAKFKNKIANILIGLGLLEVSTYHISNKNNQCRKMEFKAELVELANSLTNEYDVLRYWLVPSLLEVLSNNKHNEYPQNIFEMGVIFKKGKTETGVGETTRLCVMESHKDANFTKLKQILDYLLGLLDLKAEIKEAEHPSFIPGRVGRVSVKGKNVAYIGELSPKVLSNWELVMPASCFELNLTELYKLI